MKFVFKEKLLLFALLFGAVSLNAQNPYEQFGVEGKILQTEFEQQGSYLFEIESPDENSSVKRIEFDFSAMRYKAYGENDSLLLQGAILIEVPKRWMSRDPLAAEYPYNSPYCFVSNDPINRIDPDGRGDYYAQDGTYLGNDDIVDNKTYTANQENLVFNECGIISGWSLENPPVDLLIDHDVFKKISQTILHEGLSEDKREYLYLAHTVNNRADKLNISILKLLLTGYSSVNKKIKNSGLDPNNNSLKANASRSGIIDVLVGNEDPTKGAEFFDGTDFLAWGLISPNDTPHNKFEEYASITIPLDIFTTYLNNNRSKYGKSVGYYKKKYNIPAEVYLNESHWNNNLFFYETTVNNNYHLQATATAGYSIFWRIVR